MLPPAMADVSTPPAGEREPGAPIGRDEIDPELVKLRRPALAIGAVAAAAVVILCLGLMLRLRHDFAFSREGSTPREVQVADIVAGHVGDDAYITLVAPPDRTGAIRVRTSEASAGHRLVAARGTGDRVWLALPGDPWAAYAHDDRVTGRLRRLDDVRFAGPLASALRAHPSPRFVTGDEYRRARGVGDGRFTLLDGTTFGMGPTDEVEISVEDPGAAIVIAAISPSRPDVAAWTSALAEAGVIAPGAAPFAATTDLLRWEVRRPDAKRDLQERLDGAQLWGARVEPATTRVRGGWKDLAVSDAGVTGPAGVVPWTAIDVVALWAPRTVPAGAWVVLTDERPGDYWYLTLIFAGLALIGALFTWALVRAVRRQFFAR